MRIAFLASIITSFILLAASCETEVDVNAPFEDIAVVYALFDPDSTEHAVKVTRLFQGEDNANFLAQDRSLQEYEGLTGVLEEISVSGRDTSVVNEWAISEDAITDKDSGLFYFPEQRVYRLSASLNRSALFRLKLTKPDGGLVSAVTPMVWQPDFEFALDPNTTVRWRTRGMFLISTNGDVDESVDFEVTQPINAKSFDASITFRYKELYTDSSESEIKSIELDLGSYEYSRVRETESSTAQQVIVGIPTVAYFEAIARAVPDITPNSNVLRRLPDTTSAVLQLYFAGEELDTYIEVTSPSTSLLEDKPPYTNVSNGIGIVSTRTRRVAEIRFNAATYNELSDGIIFGLTGAKGFCNPFAGRGMNNSCFN